MKSTSKIILAGLFALTLAGCNDGFNKKTPTIDSNLNQEDLCVTVSKNKATQCKAGQKVVFVPNSWGNEQLPIIFAAINCDMRYSVAMNNGGVTCIYVGEKKTEENANPEKSVERKE